MSARSRAAPWWGPRHPPASVELTVVPVGEHIREHVIPAGMTVTEAAGRLGVGRPALSNLLNGNAKLSMEMAARLEAVFGCDGRALMRQQLEAELAAEWPGR